MKLAAALVLVLSTTAIAQMGSSIPGSGAGAAYDHMAAQNQQLGMAAASMFAMMAAQRQRQFMLQMNEDRFTRQVQAESEKRALETSVVNGTSQQMQEQSEAAIASLRSQGVDNTMMVAALHREVDLHELMEERALLQAAAAQAAGPAQAPQAVEPPTPDMTPTINIRPTYGFGVEKPKFSVPPGQVDVGTKVKLRTDTHYSTLYYTTNGWTPTTLSRKYAGPLTINTTTHLQVMAIGPNYLRSNVERADYTVPNSPPPSLEATVAIPQDGTIRTGTPVRVVFGGKDIDSETAEVGDEITLLLDEDIKMGDVVLAAKGSKVNAVLTIADPGHGSAPGDLVFEVRSVDVGGKRVPLFGGETLEGVKGGKNAVIKPGMVAVAFVSADTSVKP